MFEEIRRRIPKRNRPIGLEPLRHTPKLNQSEAGQSQPRNQSQVSGPICSHRASLQAMVNGGLVIFLLTRSRGMADHGDYMVHS